MSKNKCEEITPDEIKRIRGKYGLSQKAFARVLGIGEASMFRYESGQTPTRANANLIRAADRPAFMLDCLLRDGHRIGQEKSECAKKVIYAEVYFNDWEGTMDINEIYELTLQQEILNEQAAHILADLHRMQGAAEKRGDSVLAAMFQDITMQIARAKGKIIHEEYCTESGVSELKGQILGLMEFARQAAAKAA